MTQSCKLFILFCFLVSSLAWANGNNAKIPAPHPVPLMTKPHHPKPIAPQAKPSGPKRLWNLRNADIHGVIEAVSKATGKNFILDQRVSGKVTIISSKPLGADEVYQVFLSVLQISGYSAIPFGNLIKIVPDVDAKGYDNPLVRDFKAAQGDENIVRVVPVRYVSAQQLVPTLRPLLPQWSYVSAYIPSNSIILGGRASNIRRIVRIIRQVDTKSHNDIDVIVLHNALASDITKTISNLQKGDLNIRHRINLAADDTSNSILISGNREERLRLRFLISELDTPNRSGAGNTQVIYLQYLQAKDLAPVLGGVARSNFRGDVGVTIGTRTIDVAPELSHPSKSGDDSYFVPRRANLNQRRDVTSKTTKAPDTTRPHVEIIAETNTNSLILNAPPALMRTLKSVVSQLDIRPQQVAIEALIAEVNEDDLRSLGIEWGTRPPEGTTESPMAAFRAGFGIIRQGNLQDFEFQFNALATNNQVDILATPSLVVLDNHLAHIKVGQQFSVIQSSFPNNANGTTTATPFNTFDRQDVALVLNVKPQVTRSNTIKLSISHKNDTPQDPSDKSGVPIFNISEISTSVLVNNGDILVLGGLIQNSIRDRDISTPILGEFPGIGRLFHHQVRERTKQKLMVFIRPVILDSRQKTINVTTAKYNRTRKAQLASVRKQGYQPDNAEFILEDRTSVKHLPLPFQPRRSKHHA